MKTLFFFFLLPFLLLWISIIFLLSYLFLFKMHLEYFDNFDEGLVLFNTEEIYNCLG